MSRQRNFELGHKRPEYRKPTWTIVGMDGDSPSFWSNEQGWVDSHKDASHFREHEIGEGFSLPQGKNVTFMPGHVSDPKNFGDDWWDSAVKDVLND